MPFDQPSVRSLTASAVCEHAPPLPGVYGIASAGQWIYIGEAANLREALLDYLGETGTALLARLSADFVFELCDLALRCNRQDRLVLEYEPASNRHWTMYRGGSQHPACG